MKSPFGYYHSNVVVLIVYIIGFFWFSVSLTFLSKYYLHKTKKLSRSRRLWMKLVSEILCQKYDT